MKYEKITSYIKIFSDSYSAGDWIVGDRNGGKNERPVKIPFIKYDKSVFDFMRDMHGFMDNRCEETLSIYGVDIDELGEADIDVSQADDKEVIALITYVIRSERFCDGKLKNAVESGKITNWLRRLEELDSIETVLTNVV